MLIRAIVHEWTAESLHWSVFTNYSHCACSERSSYWNGMYCFNMILFVVTTLNSIRAPTPPHPPKGWREFGYINVVYCKGFLLKTFFWRNPPSTYALNLIINGFILVISSYKRWLGSYGNFLVDIDKNTNSVGNRLFIYLILRFLLNSEWCHAVKFQG